MPVRNCIAVGCTSDRRKNKDIRFVIQFPKVESALKKWLDLLRRDGVKCRPDLEALPPSHFKTILSPVRCKNKNWQYSFFFMYEFQNLFCAQKKPNMNQRIIKQKCHAE